MGVAIESNDDLEVQRISTVLTSEANKGSFKRYTSSKEQAMAKLQTISSNSNSDDKKPTLVSNWDFLGSKRQWINTFNFLSDGSVIAHHDYAQATWQQLDEKSILFSYGPESSYIVFQIESNGLYRGFASSHGKARYIRTKK